MGNRWRESKIKRAEMVGWKCEVCGVPLNYRNIVGHHVRFRCFGGGDGVDNCEIHCQSCERAFKHTAKNNGKRVDGSRQDIFSPELPKAATHRQEIVVTVEYNGKTVTVRVPMEDVL